MSGKLKLLFMLALVACSILGCQLTLASPVNTILLRHIGSQDAAVPDIVFKIGTPGQSERATVLMGKEDLEWLAKTFSKSSSAKSNSPLPFGTFEAEAGFDKVVSHKSLIQTEDMDRILGELFKKLKARGVQSPDLLVRIRSMIGGYRKT